MISGDYKVIDCETGELIDFSRLRVFSMRQECSVPLDAFIAEAINYCGGDSELLEEV